VVAFGTDSVAMAREIIKDKSPDTVFCDVGLGKESGIDFIKEMKTDISSQELRVIAMGGRSENKSPALKAGADMFLQKPFSIGYLRKYLRESMGFYPKVMIVV
jgi:DNA-binding response OmpR family regulator